MTTSNTRVALVTGASSGIGEAAAKLLASQGFTVYAAARRLDRLQQIQSPGVIPIQMDVTDDASTQAAVDRIVAEQGRIDTLVNNAGYGSYGAVEDVPLAEARRQFDVNVFGLARLTQQVLPHMRAQKAGTIINVSSMGGKIYTTMGAWYHATKFAVEGFSDCLRLELAPHGIHVVLIEPGAIKTEWGQVAADNLLSTSGTGAYAKQATAAAKTLAGEGNGKLSSRPETVAKTISKAARSRRPRTRYTVGMGAKPLITLRKILPDRAFDRVARSMMGTS